MALLIIIGLVAAVGGLLVGALSAGWLADRRFKRQMAEIGGEIVRMRAIAESKLAGDDPDLATLLKNLQGAADNAYRAIEALEHQAELTRRKSAGSLEVIAASRQVLRMMEDLGADVPEAPIVTAQTLKLAPSVSAKAAPALPEAKRVIPLR